MWCVDSGVTWTRLQASGSHLAPHLEKQCRRSLQEEREPKDKLRRGISSSNWERMWLHSEQVSSAVSALLWGQIHFPPYPIVTSWLGVNLSLTSHAHRQLHALQEPPPWSRIVIINFNASLREIFQVCKSVHKMIDHVIIKALKEPSWGFFRSADIFRSRRAIKPAVISFL